MASLNFTGLQKVQLTPDRYTYSDLQLTGLDVVINEDEQTYTITLSIEIPALNNKKIKIPGTITKTGYTFL